MTVTVPSNGILVMETDGMVALPDGKIGLGAAEPVKIGPAGADDGVKCSDVLTEDEDDDG